jgi:chromosome segregation ATPase
VQLKKQLLAKSDALAATAMDNGLKWMELRKLASTVENLQKKLGLAEIQLKESFDSKEAIELDMVCLQDTLATSELNVLCLADTLEASEVEVLRLQDTLAARDSTVVTLQDMVATQEEANGRLKMELKAMGTLFEAADSEVTRLSANGQLARAFEEIDELSRYAKAAKAKIDTLEMDRAGVTRARAPSNDRGTELSDRLEEMETLVFKQAAVAKSAANTKELVELRKTVRRLETDIFALEGQVVRKDGQIERLKRSSAAVMPSPSKRVKRR